MKVVFKPLGPDINEPDLVVTDVKAVLHQHMMINDYDNYGYFCVSATDGPDTFVDADIYRLDSVVSSFLR